VGTPLFVHKGRDLPVFLREKRQEARIACPRGNDSRFIQRTVFVPVRFFPRTLARRSTSRSTIAPSPPQHQARLRLRPWRMHAQAQHHVGPAVVKKWRHHGRTRPAAEGPAPVRDSVCARGAAVQLPYVSPRPRAFFLVLFRCFSQSRSPAPVLAGVSLSLTRQPTPGMSSAQLYRWHAARVPERRAVFPALLPCCPQVLAAGTNA